MLVKVQVKSKGLFLDIFVSTHHPDATNAELKEADALTASTLKELLGIEVPKAISLDRFHVIYNEFALKNKWTTSHKVAPSTARAIKKALKYIPDEEGWRGAFKAMEKDKWFSGKGVYRPSINSILREERYETFYNQYMDSKEGLVEEKKSVDDILDGFRKTLETIKP